jgi:hypothetical protein
MIGRTAGASDSLSGDIKGGYVLGNGEAACLLCNPWIHNAVIFSHICKSGFL